MDGRHKHMALREVDSFNCSQGVFLWEGVNKASNKANTAPQVGRRCVEQKG